jgi:hypothetical protein
LLSSLILIASPEPKSLHTTAAAFGQTIQRASRGPVLFSGSIQNEAATAGELPAELVIARFVREQSLLARSGPYVSGRPIQYFREMSFPANTAYISKFARWSPAGNKTPI